MALKQKHAQIHLTKEIILQKKSDKQISGNLAADGVISA
jgi:hypothetical protein